MNRYEQKQEARRERMERRAAKASAEAEALYSRAKSMASVIPFGQPILVGHHSEGRDRNYRAKIGRTYDRAYEALDKAEHYKQKAAGVGEGGISSDDPDAIAKLTEQLTELAAKQDSMKAANVAWRKAGNKAGRQADGTWIDPPHATFTLSNNSANMRRIEQRIRHLQNAKRVDMEVRYTGDVIARQDTTENRVMIIFPGKPDAATRTALKRHGFRWSPTNGAWQRQLNNSGVYQAKEVLRSLGLEPVKEEETPMVNHPNRSQATAADPHKANDLYLFTVNTSAIYHEHAQRIMSQLAAAKRGGTYSEAAAETMWQDLAAVGAQFYAKEFGGEWHRLFSTADRRAAAVDIAAHYAEELAEKIDGN